MSTSMHVRRVALAPPISGDRVAYVDNLKVVMVAGVIAWHGIAGYLDIGGVWTYGDVAEGFFGTVSESITLALVGPASMFVMGLFFLIAGLMTPGSFDRKGPRRFARERLIRLGIPLAAFTFVLWPLMSYACTAPPASPAACGTCTRTRSRRWTTGSCGSSRCC